MRSRRRTLLKERELEARFHASELYTSLVGDDSEKAALERERFWREFCETFEVVNTVEKAAAEEEEEPMSKTEKEKVERQYAYPELASGVEYKIEHTLEVVNLKADHKARELTVPADPNPMARYLRAVAMVDSRMEHRDNRSFVGINPAAVHAAKRLRARLVAQRVTGDDEAIDHGCFTTEDMEEVCCAVSQTEFDVKEVAAGKSEAVRKMAALSYLIDPTVRTEKAILNHQELGGKETIDKARHVLRDAEATLFQGVEGNFPPHDRVKAAAELIHFALDLKRDPEGTTFNHVILALLSTPPPGTGKDDWMDMETVDLTEAAGNRKRTCKRVWKRTYEGQVRHMALWCVNRRVFGVRKRVHGGGGLLIDMSGSMSWEIKDLEKVYEAAPMAWVAGYNSEDPSCGGGHLYILARNGRICDLRHHHLRLLRNKGNGVDGVALRVLAKQSAPRVWVSDFGVHGRDSTVSQECLQRDCLKIMKFGNIERVDHLTEALEWFKGRGAGK